MNNCPTNKICINQYILIILLAIPLIYLYFVNTHSLTKTPLHKKIDNTTIDDTNLDINQIDHTNKTIKVIDNTPKKVETNIIYSNSFEDNSPPLYVVNKNINRLINPLLPPERSSPYTNPYSVDISPIGTGLGLPINISTRGPMVDYSQIGVLTNHDNGKNTILPLYGKPTYHGSSKWLYYTSTDKYNSIKIPINYKNRNCSDDTGCDELSEGDNLNVPAYNNTFKVTTYQLDKPRYIPYI